MEIFKHKSGENSELPCSQYLSLIIIIIYQFGLIFGYLFSGLFLKQNSIHFIKHFLEDFYIMLINVI